LYGEVPRNFDQLDDAVALRDHITELDVQLDALGLGGFDLRIGHDDESDLFIGDWEPVQKFMFRQLHKERAKAMRDLIKLGVEM